MPVAVLHAGAGLHFRRNIGQAHRSFADARQCGMPAALLALVSARSLSGAAESLGLRLAVLLPVNARWAGMLLRLDGEKMDFREAYEVHLGKERHALGGYLKLFTSDLEIAQRTFPGAVFMWETSAPLPLFVRRLVRQGSADGSAFLKNGGWRAPRFPFTGTDLKKGRVKHGAINNIARS